ncbi:N/A [soil metagenome]
MHKTEDKHIFAVYVADLFTKQKIMVGDSVPITDEDVVHRILTVLRMEIGQELMLFDEKHHYLVVIADTKKNKALRIEIDTIFPNTQPKLEINFVLPLLKKEALEEVIYSLTEIGVTSISLVITSKSQKQLTDKELIRLQKMKVAAAEQSKNYTMPIINKPIAFERFCTEFGKNATPAVLFEPSGNSALELISELKQKKIKKIACLIGPEAGLTTLEIELATQIGFKPCKLTGTVLRAVQAAAVGAGLIASLLT